MLASNQDNLDARSLITPTLSSDSLIHDSMTPSRLSPLPELAITDIQDNVEVTLGGSASGSPGGSLQDSLVELPRSSDGHHFVKLAIDQATSELEERTDNNNIASSRVPLGHDGGRQPAIAPSIVLEEDEAAASHSISENIDMEDTIAEYALSRQPNSTGHLAYLTSDTQTVEGEEDQENNDLDPLLRVEASRQSYDSDDILIKVGVPEGYGPLTAKPLVLTSTILIIVLAFNFGCVLSMIIILLRPGPDRKFYTSHPDIQFVIRYVPSFLGTITTLAARTMYFAFNRLEFYIGMADPDPGPKLGTRFSQGKDTVARPYSEAISWSDLFNHLRGWSPRHSRYWLRLIVVANAILISFLTSFKATFLLASANPTSTDPNGWMVVVSPFSTLVLIVLYTINVTTLVSLLVHLWSRCTGLKWDPVTIADHLALFHDSNVLDDFEILEKEPDQLSRKLLADKEYRIGYWEKGKEHRLVYGIGRETHPGNGEDAELQNGLHPAEVINCQPGQNEESCTSTSHLPFCTCSQEYDAPRDPHTKNSYYAPWLGWFWWIICLLSAGVCIYAWAQGAVEKGFKLPNTWWKAFPHLISDVDHSSSMTTPSNTTFDPSKIDSSPANISITGVFQDDPAAHDLFLYVFVFRNIIVFLSSLLAIVFIERIDLGHRFSQPFANMAKSDASATESILLNYHWGTPGIVTIDALKNSHWRVAIFSSLNLVSPLFPIFVAGLFTLTNTGDWIVFDIHKASFYAVFGYLVLYTLALPFAWPRRNRRLPRFFMSIADLMSLCYVSHVIKDPALDISGAKTTQRHLESRLFLQEETYRVGLYTGSDGKKHFGFDTAYIQDSVGRTVEHVRHLREWPLVEASSLNQSA